MIRNPEHLYRRGGVWWIRYSTGGSQIRRSLRTKSTAEAKRRRDLIIGKRGGLELVKETFGVETARADAAPAVTFGQVVDRYRAHLEFRHATNKRMRKQSLGLTCGVLNNWLVPAFGKRPISAITVEDAKVFLTRLHRAKKKKGAGRLGQKQIFTIYSTAKRVCQWALRKQMYVGVNPFDLDPEERPVEGEGRKAYLTPEEVTRLLEVLDGQMFHMVALAVYTGLRWGEVCGLSWTDIDLTSTPRTLRVQRSYQGPPKNETATNPIELNDDAVSILRSWKARSGDCPCLFPSKLGTTRRRMSGPDRKVLKERANEAGISKLVTPHIFRHTFGTLLYLATKDAVRVQYAMRHANVETTLRRYVHPSRSQGMTEAVNAMPSMLPLASPVLRAV